MRPTSILMLPVISVLQKVWWPTKIIWTLFNYLNGLNGVVRLGLDLLKILKACNKISMPLYSDLLVFWYLTKLFAQFLVHV